MQRRLNVTMSIKRNSFLSDGSGRNLLNDEELGISHSPFQIHHSLSALRQTINTTT
jgi:hypothetical protein